ncbi:hypothetical protein [Deinococcus hohokamensis]|uniref:GGDEF domain-containing protein n=1 Tax=Deinococcus hohokamensis TaxID=309883 RepID=A0ABV9I7Y7_9DEIO
MTKGDSAVAPTIEKSIKLRLILLLAAVAACAFAASSFVTWPLAVGVLLLAATGLVLSPAWSLGLGLTVALVAALLWSQGLFPGAAGPLDAPTVLWLLVAGLLPRLVCEVMGQARTAQQLVLEQGRLLGQQADLHAITGLPGPGLAQMFMTVLQAEYQRSGGQGAALAVWVKDLPVARQLYEPQEVALTLQRARDAVRSELRASDWLFQLRDDLFLVFANVGHEPDGHLIMARRVAGRVGRVNRISMQTQVMLVPPGMAFPVMLRQLLEETPPVTPAEPSPASLTPAP